MQPNYKVETPETPTPYLAPSPATSYDDVGGMEEVLQEDPRDHEELLTFVVLESGFPQPPIRNTPNAN